MLKHAIALVVSVLVVFGSGADTIQGVEINFATIGSPGYGAPGSLGYVDYSYRIGQTEVSVAQFLASGISTTSTNGSPLRWGSAGSGMPAVYMNWHEAAMYCNFLTTGSTNSGAYTVSGGVVTGVDRAGAIAAYGTAYVLPTEDEWYKAAYFTGSGFSLYANGTGIASIDEIDAVYGRDASAGPWTAGSGTSEQNGTFNMMGNVWEWLETAEDGTLDFDPAERVVFRGGDFFQGGDLLASSTNGVPELLSSAYFNTGLRVVEIIPEPAAVSLMGISTIGLFLGRSMRRRKRAGQSLLPVRHEYLCDQFCSQEEWDACPAQFEQPELLDRFKQLAKQRALAAWGRAAAVYKRYDRVFWDKMVEVHERRVVRKEAFKKALSRKVQNAFDAFLAIIMK